MASMACKKYRGRAEIKGGDSSDGKAVEAWGPCAEWAPHIQCRRDANLLESRLAVRSLLFANRSSTPKLVADFKDQVTRLRTVYVADEVK